MTVKAGKGLREPCDPHRSAYYFGAPLNSVDADNWNCLPQVIEETDTFDLAGLPQNVEIVMAIALFEGVDGQLFNVRIRWYRERDGAKLCDWSKSKYDEDWEWYYRGAGLGYCDWEINENGRYYVRFDVTGDFSRTVTHYINITGLGEEEPEVPEVPELETGIVESLKAVAVWFRETAWDIAGVAVLGPYLATPFYWIAAYFDEIAQGFEDLLDWINQVVDTLTRYLDWDTLREIIIGWLPDLSDLVTWFGSWWDNVGSAIDYWWATHRTIIKDWVDSFFDTVRAPLQQLEDTVDGILAWIDELQLATPDLEDLLAWFGSWWDNVIDTVEIWWSVRIQDVRDLVDNAFTVRTGLWDGWQEVKAGVVEFISDPVDFIWQRFTIWFLGDE